VFFCFFACQAFAQSGSSLKEFEKKLSDYYDQELIADVISEIGKDEHVKIWSWDIGDYSLDEHNDLACVVRFTKEKSKICSVYFFIDINGTLTPVLKHSRAFVESPLEVGVAIKNNSCYVTSKKEQFNWNIISYQYRHGVFFENDQFSTSRNSGHTQEITKDLRSRRNSVHLFSTRTEETSYYHHYYDIPVYSQSFSKPFGYHQSIAIDSPDDVTKGAFYWKGKHDASLMIEQSTYDNAHWNIEVFIADDTLLQSTCDTCLQDKILIHVSAVIPELERNDTKQKTLQNEIQTFELVPNFEFPHMSFFKIALNNGSTPIKLHRESDGYRLHASIPLHLLNGFESNSLVNSTIKLGCTFELIDIDNPFRPEEQTRIVSSNFEHENPRSLGLLTFYPMGQYDGDIHNHIAEQFVQTLKQLGF
jgi:hypothetical protein